jgi:transcription elongation factor Elf1
MAITAALRCATNCVQCGTPLVVPEWSETVGAEQAIHIWHCPVCEYEFETTDNRVEQAPSEDKLIEEFLPNLLVA